MRWCRAVAGTDRNLLSAASTLDPVAGRPPLSAQNKIKISAEKTKQILTTRSQGALRTRLLGGRLWAFQACLTSSFTPIQKVLKKSGTFTARSRSLEAFSISEIWPEWRGRDLEWQRGRLESQNYMFLRIFPNLLQKSETAPKIWLF